MTEDRSTTPQLLPLERFGTATAAISFLLLFPGFFLYHFSASAGLVPRFLGGWFGPLSIGVLGAYSLLLILVPWYLRGRSLLVFAIFAILILTVLGWLAAHDVLGTTYQGHQVVRRQVLALVVLWLSLFMIGLYWPAESAVLGRALAVALPLLIALTLFNTNLENLLFSLAYQDTTQENVTTYQGFARTLAITAIVVFSLKSESRLLVPGILATVVGLFLIGARSELYGFVMVSPLMVWFGSKSRPGYTLLFAGAGVIVLVALVAANWSTLAQTRPLRVLAGLEEVGSLQQRRTFLLAGLEDIEANVLTGSYGGHFDRFGSTGAYVHNLLSAWRQYGVGVFLLYGGLIASSTVLSLRFLLKTNGAVRIWRVSLVFNVFATILVVTSKPVFWPFPALGWGLVTSALLRTRK